MEKALCNFYTILFGTLDTFELPFGVPLLLILFKLPNFSFPLLSYHFFLSYENWQGIPLVLDDTDDVPSIMDKAWIRHGQGMDTTWIRHG